ncbi:MAG TPA: hypothetical protein VGX76_06875, partial [Pirellulales bacterium]|nr:hypothetical protein [Pirellulales bacterium]
NTYRGTTLTQDVNDALAQVDGDGNNLIRQSLSPLFVAWTQAQGGLTSIQKTFQTAAQALLIAQVNADTPLAALTFQNALAVLKTQMLAAGAKVTANTVTASTVAGGSNVGNGTLVAGVKDKYGFQLDNLLAEAIAVTVTSDATAGLETLQFLGAAAVADPLNNAWPGGSGCNRTLTSCPDGSNGASLLGALNGNWELWTVNTPTSWTITGGVAGTQFQKGSSPYNGSFALEILGGTGVLTNLNQTLTTFKARTPYAINGYVKADVVPAAGTLIFDLYNGASVIQDEAGNNCSLSINCHTLTTGYVAYNAIWSIADPLPATVTLRVRTSVDITAGSNVFVDSLSIQPATQLGTYLGDSCWAAVFGGNVNWTLRDVLTLTTANNRTCQWQQAFDKLFTARQLGYMLPTTGGGATISDGLIT